MAIQVMIQILAANILERQTLKSKKMNEKLNLPTINSKIFNMAEVTKIASEFAEAYEKMSPVEKCTVHSPDGNGLFLKPISQVFKLWFQIHSLKK